MLQKTKKRLEPRQLKLLITASVLVFLILFYVIITAVIGAIDSSDGTDTPKPPEILEGEALYGNMAIAYPTFSEDAVQSVSIAYFNKEGVREKLTMMRPKKDEPFIFYYSDANGDPQVYQPPICSAESDFDYTSLYAIESSDGLNVYKITYLFASLGALYFGNRIELEGENRNLVRYGLDHPSRQSVVFTYLDADGEEVSHTVHIGDELLTGSGFYFMVDDRNYVYTSLGNYLDYAIAGLESFMHSRVVAEGLAADKGFEPYLTSDYKQWKNKVITDNTVPVSKKSKVISLSSTITPVYGITDIDAAIYGKSGYSISAYTDKTYDLSYLASDDVFKRVIGALEGKTIGSYEDREILATVIANTNAATLNQKYTYSIYAIESAFSDGADITEVGASVAGQDYVKVSYTYTTKAGDTDQKYVDAHAVIALNDPDSPIPTDALDKLRAAKVGPLTEPVTFDVTYTEENADESELKFIISEINIIFEQNGNDVTYGDVITENSTVSYVYYYTVNGEMYGGEQRGLIDLSKIDSDDGDNYTIKQALIGKGVSTEANIVALSDVMYCQAMMNFTSYSIRSIEYFVEQEMITSFKFVNYSERDPFYGESLFINTLDNKYKSYALNATACERVVRFLGGIDDEGNSSQAAGLVGSETVEVGLTPDNMIKYGKTGVGLYANTIYFELPRGIEVISSGSADSVDDYRYLDTLGFFLYVSDEMADGTRYVGSDMYDIIVKIDAEGFEFLEKSFVEFWARRSIAGVSYSDIDEVTLDFNMEDVKGSYLFELEHRDAWIVDGEAVYEKPEKGGTSYDMMTVHVSLREQGATETLVSKLLSRDGKSKIGLAKVYTEAAGADEVVMDEYDTLGTSSFKSMLQLIYSTYYTGTLTPEEQQNAKENGLLLMKMSLKVPASSAYPYTYEFYRIDDRRVMVSVYRESSSGARINEVSDFYLSTFAFKKIVTNFIGLLNGEEINNDLGYKD